MPTAIPDRYSLEVRLGRDGDIEEWLATDRSLDRPVLVRSIGPDTTTERRTRYVQAVSAAAKTTHSHLSRVFAVAETDAGAYAVLEWHGGATVADRVGAHRPVELPDFLPNASGLAGALAALHASGGVHGRIDPSAISYSGGHPAKLGAFGREGSADAGGDVRSLAAALETSLTGVAPGGPPPSERVDGVSKEVDSILRSAQSGQLTAEQLEKALRAAPTPRAPRPQTGATSRRLLLTAIGLVLLAALLVAVGFFFSGSDPTVIPTPTTTGPSQTSVLPTLTTTTVAGEASIFDVISFDPFGGGGENDQLLSNLTDTDISTEWRSETYNDPIGELKAGVGIGFDVRGTPDALELVSMSEGTVFDIYWSPQRGADLDGRERIVSATASRGITSFDLPSRDGGHWLVWMVDLPEVADGGYRVSISEVRFRS